MSDYEYEHTVETSATPADVYALWSDPSTWSSWDTSVESASIDGPFAPGTTGSMVVDGPMEVTFTLLEVTPGTGYLDETVIPDAATIRFAHRAEPSADGRTTVTVRVSANGPAAAEMGPMITSDTPDALAALVRAAEARAGA
jgi:acetylornithine deacetylase/succinyl-diaminopimelate desuccinylase-like protein